MKPAKDAYKIGNKELAITTGECMPTFSTLVDDYYTLDDAVPSKLRVHGSEVIMTEDMFAFFKKGEALVKTEMGEAFENLTEKQKVKAVQKILYDAKNEDGLRKYYFLKRTFKFMLTQNAYQTLPAAPIAAAPGVPNHALNADESPSRGEPLLNQNFTYMTLRQTYLYRKNLTANLEDDLADGTEFPEQQVCDWRTLEQTCFDLHVLLTKIGNKVIRTSPSCNLYLYVSDLPEFKQQNEHFSELFSSILPGCGFDSIFDVTAQVAGPDGKVLDLGLHIAAVSPMEARGTLLSILCILTRSKILRVLVEGSESDQIVPVPLPLSTNDIKKISSGVRPLGCEQMELILKRFGFTAAQFKELAAVVLKVRYVGCQVLDSEGQLKDIQDADNLPKTAESDWDSPTTKAAPLSETKGSNVPSREPTLPDGLPDGEDSKPAPSRLRRVEPLEPRVLLTVEPLVWKLALSAPVNCLRVAPE